jgi:uncharacterized repeat protein (TIGR02543 family)
MNEDIEYKVENYIQNEGQYVLRATEIFTGKANTTVTAEPKTLEGYTYNSAAAGALSSGTLIPGGNLTLRMYYDKSSFTISFKANGGSSVASITQQYGSPVYAPAIPSRLGYIFEGWCYDEALSGEYTFTTMPSCNTTLYAKWKQGVIAAYKVEHYQQNTTDDGYTVVDTETMNGTVETTVTATAKSYEGFTINSNNASTVNSGIVAEDGSLTLKLYYDRNTYTISFLTFGGSSVEAITQKYGTIVLLPDTTQEGRTFDGWYRDISLTNAYSLSTMPAESITLYPKWKLNTDTEQIQQE